MSSPSTQKETVPFPSTSISTTVNHDFSDDENLENIHWIKQVSEQDMNLSTEEQFDIELGVAKLVPLRRAPVRRIIIKRHSMVPPVPARSQLQGKRPQIPPRPKSRRKVKTGVRSEGVEKKAVGGSVERIASPPPSSRLPPPIPPRPQRKPKPAQTSTGRVFETTTTHLLAAPPPQDETPPPAPFLERTVRVKKAVLPPPPLPLSKRSSLTILELTRTPLSRPPGGLELSFPPPPPPPTDAQRDSDSELCVLTSASTAARYEDGEQCGLEGEEKDAVEDECEFSISGNWNPHLMRRMYSDCLAGRGRFSPSKVRLEARLEAMRDALAMKENEEEEAEEERRVYVKQRRLFGLADDGRAFRDVFLDVGMGMGVSPKTKVRGNSKGSVGRALRDESLHGLMVSPRIVGWDVEIENFETAGAAEAASAIVGLGIDGVAPEKEGGAYEYMFNGWSSFSPEDGNAEDNGAVEKQSEIINPFAGRFAVPGNEWTAFLAWRRESGSSDYSTPSRPSFPVPHMREGEKLSYSPIQSPWASAIDPVNEWSRSLKAAIDFFSGFDVEALVASMQEPGYELAETDSGKGSPEQFNLTPHKPKPSCGCEFCYRHFHPTLEILKAHDPSEWCHCSACRDFRNNKDVEKNRAELNAAWKARLDELAAEVDDAKAEEESRLLDLPDFREDDNQEEFKPKKTHRLGAWVRSHLRCLSSRE